MYIVKQFNNNLIKNILLKMHKEPIFKIGNGGGKQMTGCYELYSNKLSFLQPLINFNSNVLKKYNLDYKNIFVENREFIFNKNDEPFDSILHQDTFNDSGNKGCYTCVYYYYIDKTIKGGDLLFPPFGKYKPNQGDIIFFEGDMKHKISKLYGEGIRGILITQFEKIN